MNCRNLPRWPSLKLTASLHQKIGLNAPKRKQSYSYHPFSGKKLAVSFREGINVGVVFPTSGNSSGKISGSSGWGNPRAYRKLIIPVVSRWHPGKFWRPKGLCVSKWRVLLHNFHIRHTIANCPEKSGKSRRFERLVCFTFGIQSFDFEL